MKTLDTVTLVLAAALSHNAIAQDLTAEVAVDPQAGLAIYDFHFDGPPQGVAFPLISFLQFNPTPFPGVLGNLLIDPGLALSLPIVPLNNQGFGLATVQGPLGITNGLPLFAQAVMFDPWNNNQLAFTDFGCAVPKLVPANPNRPAVVFGTKVNNGNVTVTFAGGPANANVTVWVNGGQKATGYLVLDANGQGSIQVVVPGGMQPGDNVQVLVNGVPMLGYNH